MNSQDSIRDSILNKQAERKINIIKGFLNDDDLEKAVYADNAENRKLQRVGKEWGGKKEDGEKSENKSPSSEEAFPSKMAHEDIQKHLSATSTETLKKFASDKTRDPKLVEHAKRELEVRAQGEADGDAKPDSGKHESISSGEKQLAGDEKSDSVKNDGKQDWKEGTGKEDKNDETQKKIDSYTREMELHQNFIGTAKLGTDQSIIDDHYKQFGDNYIARQKLIDEKKSRDFKNETENVQNDSKQNWKNGTEKEEGKSEDGDFSNETENGADEEELYDILVEAVFNNQGRFDSKKFSETYSKLIELGAKPQLIEKKIGHSTWNHPDTDDEEAESHKEDWQNALSKMETHKKIQAVDSSLKDLKKHQDSLNNSKPAKGSYEEKQLKDQQKRQNGGGKQTSWRR